MMDLEDALRRLWPPVEKELRRRQNGHLHTLRVMAYARRLLSPEADPALALAAAMLHDVGIPEALARHGSDAGPHQEVEGEAISRRFLSQLGWPKDTLEAICHIVGHHHQRLSNPTPEFQVVWDADALVNWDFSDLKRRDKALAMFYTAAGQALAEENFQDAAIQVDRARMADVPQIHQLVNFYAERGEMLARPLSEIYENIRDFSVVREGEQVVACVALHVLWADLAEVKCLAVVQSLQGQGQGSRLVRACLEEALELGIETVFCLTYKPGFFQRLGFQQVDLMELPRKVWTECYRCPKFPHCDEVALIYQWLPKPLSRIGLR